MRVVETYYINCLEDCKRLRVSLILIKHAIEFINCGLSNGYI